MDSPADIEREYFRLMAKCRHDPLLFVRACFPWGEVGTDLAEEEGPDVWQEQILAAVRDKLISPHEAIKIAIASGHGVGKSALVAWLILWSIATFEDTRGIVTANTEIQLRTKTWPELAKWHRSFLGADYFEMTATRICSADKAHADTWRFDMVPWSEHNPEAFAGLHNKGKRVVIIFDEASGIHHKIWEVTEGALTDAKTEIIWLACGNPTMTTGRFRECYGKFKKRWLTCRVDSRDARMTNKVQIDEWIADWGIDSDFVRIRVLGLFPKAGSRQFIGDDIVAAAALRHVDVATGAGAPLVLGVDVARFGDDYSVLKLRRGRDGQAPAIKFLKITTVELASRAAALSLDKGADAIMVDGTGVGGGVVDLLRQLDVGKADIFEVNFGGKPDLGLISETAARGELYSNKSAEMWGSMRSWLEAGGAIENDDELRLDLTGREYGYNSNGAIIMERKEDMKKRGLASPDLADALALTFAHSVAPPGIDMGSSSNISDSFNPYSDERAGFSSR